MKPCAFEYHRPAELEHALELMAEHGDAAKLIAGGQSLVPAMNFRLAQPAVLVDINGIETLRGVEATGDRVTIGAGTRQRAVEHSEDVAREAPLVARAMPHIAHPQIRNRGTFGGSLAHADPAAELPAVACALDARLRARSARGERTIPAREFFVDLLTTALEPDELLIAVELPSRTDGDGFAFEEFARRHGDYALVGVAVAVHCAEDACTDVRACLLSVGNGPVQTHSLADALVGERPTVERIGEAAAQAAQHDLDPAGDIHASAAFRRHLAQGLLRRTLTAAFAEALSAPLANS